MPSIGHKTCREDVIDKRALTLHIVAAVVIGAIIAALSPAKWLAASLWVSAVMVLNGSLAVLEDARPGGFDDPRGSEPPPLNNRVDSARFVLGSIAMTTALVALGFVVQFS